MTHLTPIPLFPTAGFVARLALALHAHPAAALYGVCLLICICIPLAATPRPFWRKNHG